VAGSSVSACGGGKRELFEEESSEGKTHRITLLQLLLLLPKQLFLQQIQFDKLQMPRQVFPRPVAVVRRLHTRPVFRELLFLLLRETGRRQSRLDVLSDPPHRLNLRFCRLTEGKGEKRLAQR
jgi:hypothetical protein